ncbi:MAG: 2-C-methyl-D-erythritol 4-phosphate cytidylyltransferase [Solirubrobacteraceae bacterium]
MRAVALVVAAGRGERRGSSGPKALVMLAGRPMLEWSIEALRAVPAIEEIVVALPAGVMAPPGARGVAGGRERSHSVRAALAAARPSDAVLVHDAARPLLTPAIAADCLAELARGTCDAAIAAAPVTDTIKRTQGQEVVETLDRSALWAVQTPQVFRRDVLERVLAQDDAVLAAATDDASLVEAQGGTVRVVAVAEPNLKVTTLLDLRVAELLLAERS